MAGPQQRERREKSDRFQSFANRPKIKATRESKDGTVYVDYKDTETLKKLVSGNGKIHGRKRTGATAMEQRMIQTAIKRSRFMALMPYVTAAM